MLSVLSIFIKSILNPFCSFFTLKPFPGFAPMVILPLKKSCQIQGYNECCATITKDANDGLEN